MARKRSKANEIQYLSPNEGIEMLMNEKYINLFDNYADDINYRNEITNVKELLEFIESNNDSYNLIFK